MTQQHGRRAGDIPVNAIGLDEFEIGLLATMRYFITSFAAPETQGWVLAYRTAAERWGISDGAKAAYAMFDIVDAMRRARTTMFHFSDPHCPTCRETVTPNERHLMCMIHAIRRGRVGEAQTEAMLLTEGADNANMMRATWTLAGLFPANKNSAARTVISASEGANLRIH